MLGVMCWLLPAVSPRAEDGGESSWGIFFCRQHTVNCGASGGGGGDVLCCWLSQPVCVGPVTMRGACVTRIASVMCAML